jgi:DNA-binding GntR family transcriptional regulator
MAADRKDAAPIRRRVLREEIRERLVDEILSGRLGPGARIVETQLARQFGVSQAPVREALRDLALSGFVVCSPFRSTYVRRISMVDLLNSNLVRAALEGVAAREAAVGIDDDTLARLKALIADMRRAADAGDLRAQVDADIAFHHTIVRAARNDMIEHVWQFMRLATTTLVTQSTTQMTLQSLGEVGGRHETVLDALRSRDPLLAEAAMRTHVEALGEGLRQALRKEGLVPADHPSGVGPELPARPTAV